MLTAADAIITLSIPLLGLPPFQLQGFSADDVYGSDPVQSVQVSMGVDGIMSGGFVYQEVNQNITLQADSLSNDVFETWWMNMQAGETVFEAFGVTVLPALGKQYTMTKGMLTGYPPLPPAGRILGPRRYQITWEKIAPSPI